MGVRPISETLVRTDHARLYRRNTDDNGQPFPALRPSAALSQKAAAKPEVTAHASYPRLTVSRMDLDSVPVRSVWNSKIPQQALFYDEIDSISRGWRDRGVMIDRTG